jgi:hypothetical protein
VAETDQSNTAQPWLRKGELLRWAFDLAYADPNTRQARYEEALALLDGEGALDQLTAYWSADTATEFTDEHKDHFRAHWLTAPGTEEYLRGGFRDAIAHAKERNVALDAIWISAGEGDAVELGWVDNPNSVTLVILGPRELLGPVEAPKIVDPWAKTLPRLGP